MFSCWYIRSETLSLDIEQELFVALFNSLKTFSFGQCSVNPHLTALTYLLTYLLEVCLNAMGIKNVKAKIVYSIVTKIPKITVSCRCIYLRFTLKPNLSMISHTVIWQKGKKLPSLQTLLTFWNAWRYKETAAKPSLTLTPIVTETKWSKVWLCDIETLVVFEKLMTAVNSVRTFIMRRSNSSDSHKCAVKSRL